MSTIPEDNRVRRALRGAIKLMVFVGVALVIYTFSRSFTSVDIAQSGGTLRVPLAAMAPGTWRALEWEGRRYLIIHRDTEMLALLKPDSGPPLADAESRRSRQPEGMEDRHRSLDPRYFVVLDYDTALNCPLEVVIPRSPDSLGWAGGLRARCGESRYDFAGRVVAGERAVRNLSVPGHRIEGDTLVILGD